LSNYIENLRDSMREWVITLGHNPLRDATAGIDGDDYDWPFELVRKDHGGA